MSATQVRPRWCWVVVVVLAFAGLAACSGDGKSSQSETVTVIPRSPTSGDPEPFKGRLGGYEIVPGGAGLPTRTGFDVCPIVGMEPPAPGTDRQVVTAPGPLRIDPASMPASVIARDTVSAFLCRGELAEVFWSFFAQPGTPGANPGGSPVFVFRQRGNQPIIHGAPAAQWTEVTIGGLPAIAARPNRPIEACFAAVYNPATGVQTTVNGEGAQLDLCLKVIEAVVSN